MILTLSSPSPLHFAAIDRQDVGGGPAGEIDPGHHMFNDRILWHNECDCAKRCIEHNRTIDYVNFICLHRSSGRGWPAGEPILALSLDP